MAYAQTTPVIVKTTINGRRYWHISFSETECGPSTEWTVPASADLPKCGTITFYTASLTAGTGTTVQPIVKKATGVASTSINYLGQVSAAAANVRAKMDTRYNGMEAMFGLSTPNNAATDHSVTTEITLAEGHL